MQRNQVAGRVLAALLIAGGVCAVAAGPAFSKRIERQQAHNTGTTSSTAVSQDDMELVRAIQRDLQNAGMVDLDKVRVDVTHGVVTLTGEVDSALARDRAMGVAHTYSGVEQVVDRMSLRSATRTDAQLKDDVQRMLEQHSTLGHDVNVEVHDGNVKLSGHTDTYQDRELANDLAAGVSGVRQVHNEVEVHLEGEPRKDADIRQDIESRIQRSDCEACDDVTVNVNQGKVTLNGTVDSSGARNDLVDMVWVPGVVAVNGDQLKIDLHEATAQANAPTHPGQVPAERSAAYRPDETLELMVRDVLEDDPMLSNDMPAVHVNNGVVYLTGMVASERAKQHAGDVAEDIDGVVRVQNDLQVRKASPAMDDEAIRKRIETALHDDPYFQSHQVRVQVDNGVARLTGRVSSERERAAAEDIARGVKGVTDVTNDLVASNY